MPDLMVMIIVLIERLVLVKRQVENSHLLLKQISISTYLLWDIIIMECCITLGSVGFIGHQVVQQRLLACRMSMQTT